MTKKVHKHTPLHQQEDEDNNYVQYLKISRTIEDIFKEGTMPTFDDHPQMKEYKEGDIFVFGSNLAGRHGAGAARFAKIHFGARQGIGEGRTGMAYALPTKDEFLKTLPLEKIQLHIGRFIAYVERNPHEHFFVTKVGCGLAGYNEEQILPLFREAPWNCTLPEGWR